MLTSVISRMFFVLFHMNHLPNPVYREFSIQPDQYSKSDALISPNFQAPQQRGGKVVNTASSSRVPLQFRPQTAVKKEEVVDPLVEFYEGGSVRYIVLDVQRLKLT